VFRLLRVQLLLAGGSGFAEGGAPPGASILLLVFPPLPFSSGVRWCGQGIESPKAARVGKALEAMTEASYRRDAVRGTWTAEMQRRGAWSHRDDDHDRRGRALAPASAKAVKGGDDDDDITMMCA
jgi:hypothetical protein